MIHYLFGISVLTPAKIAWVALTLLNAGMMLWLSFIVLVERRERAMSRYMVAMALIAIIQGTRWWNLTGECLLALYSSLWVWSLLPRDGWGRIFVLSIGALIGAALMYAVPPPWPHYDPAMYYTRLYSAAIFMGVVFAACLIEKINRSTLIAVPWFGAVLLASSQRGWDRWTVAIWTNLIWTFCLICWLAISRQDAAQGIRGGGLTRASVLPVPDPHE